MKTDYDVITVGGGLGAAALAKVLAENGKHLLVVERETEFKDRIRGEWMAPWGVVELQKLGLYDSLNQHCANDQPFVEIIGMGPPRDLRATTAPQIAAWTFYHPAMQELVLNAASAAGAEIWRGARVRQVRSGSAPAVMVERGGTAYELSARLIVAADGRSSSARQWGDFATRRADQKLLGAGVVLENTAAREDTSVLLFDANRGRAISVFPQRNKLARAYLLYRNDIERLQGEHDKPRFVEECIKSGMPAELYKDCDLTGPLATFDMTETWVDHPYREGVALLGDAAGSSDPTWGQGLSLTSRDARVLAEKLLSSTDWDAAANSYAEEHDRYFTVSREVGQWFFDVLLAHGETYDRLRERAFPLMLTEPERMPDHGFSGPELPFNEEVRKRFFGEI